ncbi:MAG: TIGR00269 family protein [Nanoarchaeota archaeon]|nr:TIGR00269 family protein [Nanoarchaeota archaeon]
MASCSCGKPAVYYKAYEARLYCKGCFCRSIEKRVKKTITKYKLLQSNDTVAVGFSSGKDSTSLLHLLHEITGPRRDMKLVAISIDEGITGYRDTSLKLAKQVCAGLGIDHKIVSFKEAYGKTLDDQIPKIEQGKACTYCGVARRQLLNWAAREAGATKLAVGHNLDDEVQAILMNWIRGDLVRASRLGTRTEGNDPNFIPRIKPLRFIPERETALYASLKGFPVHQGECPHATGIRFDIRDFLNQLETTYPGTKFSLIEGFEKIQPFLTTAVAKTTHPITRCASCKEPSSQERCKACELWSY